MYYSICTYEFNVMVMVHLGIVVMMSDSILMRNTYLNINKINAVNRR